MRKGKLTHHSVCIVMLTREIPTAIVSSALQTKTITFFVFLVAGWYLGHLL
jgi:hypothetical protein